MAKKKNKKIKVSRPGKDIILEFIALGRGHIKEKTKLADELGLSFDGLKYRVKKFTNGKGIGRQQRSDKGVPKKDPELQTKLKFFAELALGSSIDEATRKLALTEHQGNMLAKVYAKVDKWKAIRNAPQLDDLKDIITDLFRIDIALVDAEMHGAFNVQIGDVIISIPTEELNDIKAILAHCMQRDEMAKIDPAFAGISKDELERVRVYFLKEDLLEKRNVTEYTRLHRAVKPSTPEKQLDLRLVYAIIDRLTPGMDETAKIKIIKEEFQKLKV